MGDKTGIQWTGRTWNPVVGCSVISPGCKNCYAMKTAHRLARMGGKTGEKYQGLTEVVNGKPVWNGTVRPYRPQLHHPLGWRRKEFCFVNSMSDLFHEDLPWDFIDEVFGVMALSDRTIFQILTKRPEGARYYLTNPIRGTMVEGNAQKIDFERTGIDSSFTMAVNLPLKNVWIGTSIESRRLGITRSWHLGLCPAEKRFWSLEPLLEDLGDLTQLGLGIMIDDRPVVDWVIVGGESGPGARPMVDSWARSVVKQCQAAGVPVFVKQLGTRPYFKDPKGGDMDEWPEDLRVREMPT